MKMNRICGWVLFFVQFINYESSRKNPQGIQSIISNILTKTSSLIGINFFKVSFKADSLKEIIISLNDRVTSPLKFLGIDITYHHSLLETIERELSKNKYLIACFVYLNKLKLNKIYEKEEENDIELLERLKYIKRSVLDANKIIKVLHFEIR